VKRPSAPGGGVRASGASIACAGGARVVCASGSRAVFCRSAGLARAGRAGVTRAPRFLAGRESRACATGSSRSVVPACLDERPCSFGVSTRSRRGSVTRGVRADRVGAKLPSSGAAFGRSQGVMKTDATHDERRRAARAGRPLARETSADTGRKPFERRKAREGRKRRRHPDSAVDVADGASTPSGGFSSQSSASWARPVGRHEPGIGRSSGCARGLFWLQKSTRGVWSKSVTTLGNQRGGRWV